LSEEASRSTRWKTPGGNVGLERERLRLLQWKPWGAVVSAQHASRTKKRERGGAIGKTNVRCGEQEAQEGTKPKEAITAYVG
jgi:hypothetical protein